MLKSRKEICVLELEKRGIRIRMLLPQSELVIESGVFTCMFRGTIFDNVWRVQLRPTAPSLRVHVSGKGGDRCGFTILFSDAFIVIVKEVLSERTCRPAGMIYCTKRTTIGSGTPSPKRKYIPIGLCG